MEAASKRGLQEIRAGRYFEAHEELEEGWRAAAPDERDFFQGLVHVAVARSRRPASSRRRRGGSRRSHLRTVESTSRACSPRCRRRANESPRARSTSTHRTSPCNSLLLASTVARTATAAAEINGLAGT